MSYIIRNLFLVKNSLLLLSENFGDNQSLSINDDLISSFLSALISFSTLVSESSIKAIDFDVFTLYFYKVSEDSSILSIAIADRSDKENEIDFKLRKITSFFLDKYKNNLNNFNGERSQFQDFKQFLIDKKIFAKN